MKPSLGLLCFVATGALLLLPRASHADFSVGIERIEWHGRVLFPPPDEPRDLDHITAGHIGSLELVGRWEQGGLRRWVFRSIGIDDCSSYGVWVLDIRGATATMRRVVRMCINGTVAILWWQPRAQVLVTTWAWTPAGVARLAFDLD